VTYRQIVEELGLWRVCLNDPPCGLSATAHRGTIFLGVIHFRDRRFSRRGLRKLLLLCAKRDRLASVNFLNDPGLWFAYFYLDERKANEWAAQIGVRFPVSFSAPERRAVSLVPGLSRTMPAIWAWARRGVLVNERYWRLDDADAQATSNFL
jgi:hypothetical protein